VKLIIGLGNPEKKYESTRHNAGFLAIDYHLKDLRTISCQGKFQAQICELHFGREKVFFVKPQTYMNNSGEAVRKISDFYKVSFAADLLVIHDDTDLPLGTIRATSGSSSAGHNGVRDIIEKLGTQEFHRIRIGVETRDNKQLPPTDAFVLQNFTGEELVRLQDEILPRVSAEIDKFIQKK
jgi:PTH1 family peptidyl-tRNA hydrolase